MTMPHLMNCSHSEDGWCLDCVKALWKERRCDIRPAVDEFSRLMERQLHDNHTKAALPRPTSCECFVAIQKHLCFLQECDQELSRSCNERDGLVSGFQFSFFQRKMVIRNPTKAVDLRPICRAMGLPEPVPEFRFHPKRKWRFDWAFLEEKIALEIDGGIWIPGGGRHTRGVGFEKDCEKLCEAVVLGWKVMRVTPQMLEDGRAFEWLKRLLSPIATLTEGR